MILDGIDFGDDKAFTRKLILWMVVGVLFVVVFLVGEEFGRREAIHNLPRCTADEYIYNRSGNVYPSRVSDLGCLPFDRRPK